MRPVCSSPLFKGFLAGSVVKNPPAMLDTQGTGSVLGSGRSPGGGHGTPLQCCHLENPTGRGAWQAPGPRLPGSSLGSQGLAAFLLFFSLSLISWEQEHCKYLTNPFSENRGNRTGSGLMSGKHNTVRPEPAAPAAHTVCDLRCSSPTAQRGQH